MLVYDPAKRASAKSSLTHAYFVSNFKTFGCECARWKPRKTDQTPCDVTPTLVSLNPTQDGTELRWCTRTIFYLTRSGSCVQTSNMVPPFPTRRIIYIVDRFFSLAGAGLLWSHFVGFLPQFFTQSSNSLLPSLYVLVNTKNKHTFT